MSERWLFGCGSLIWRPGFPHHEARVARVDGWVRRHRRPPNHPTGARSVILRNGPKLALSRGEC